MQKIIPHIWFDKNAEEAVAFYTSLFNNGKTLTKTHYTEAGYDIHHMEAGTVLTVEFEIEGYKLIALNGGPVFKPNPSISFFVDRKSKEELDALWNSLSEGGRVLMPLTTYPFSEYYGWVEDIYGVSWQLMLLQDEGEIPPLMPSLLFTKENAGKAEEAINLYTSVFKNSHIGAMARYGVGQEPDKEGTIAYADFILEGQKFAAMDSAQAHEFTFNEAISLLVECKDQEEIDYLWNSLSAVPEAEQCGWLKDTYGVSWQIVPSGMSDMLNDPDLKKANRAMEALLSMKKIDRAQLQKAYHGE